MGFLIREAPEVPPHTCERPPVPTMKYTGEFGPGTIWECDDCRQCWSLVVSTVGTRRPGVRPYVWGKIDRAHALRLLDQRRELDREFED